MDEFKIIKPLSNYDITDIMKSVSNFRGVFMRDELKILKKDNNECMIINYDLSKNPGTHWVSLFTRNGKSYYFDPFGLSPLPEVVMYCKRPRVYNTFEIQNPGEVICGHLCAYVLLKLTYGFEFYEVLDELYRYNRKCI